MDFFNGIILLFKNKQMSNFQVTISDFDRHF